MSAVNTIELSGLEYQVDYLLRSLERLQAENASLRQKLAAHVREHTYLAHKNQQVAVRVKKVIAQLKEELS